MSNPAENAIHRGGCLCGAVCFQTAGAPKMTMFCYCQMCQKQSGTGHTFNAIFPESAFRATGATQGYAWTADSGNKVTTEFCPTCGSPLFARSSGYLGAVVIRVASLDEPSAFEPQAAIYTKRRLSWDHDFASLPSFPAMPPPPPKSI
ncbi:MAG: GFA family protein [Rhodospirillales bacterium]|nr:GFA family protein [Rhodospirillales bacterium]